MRTRSRQKPVAVVNSARVILYLPENPLKVVLRCGSSGLFGILGGKLAMYEDPRLRAGTEVWEEAQMRVARKLQPLATLIVPNRKIQYTKRQLEALGCDTTLLTAADDDQLVVLNPVTLLFTGASKGPIPKGLIEGRAVRAFDLTKRSDLQQIKPIHREILLAWRRHLLRDQPMPCMLFMKQPI